MFHAHLNSASNVRQFTLTNNSLTPLLMLPCTTATFLPMPRLKVDLPWFHPLPSTLPFMTMTTITSCSVRVATQYAPALYSSVGTRAPPSRRNVAVLSHNWYTISATYNLCNARPNCKKRVFNVREAVIGCMWHWVCSTSCLVLLSGTSDSASDCWRVLPVPRRRLLPRVSLSVCLSVCLAVGSSHRMYW